MKDAKTPRRVRTVDGDLLSFKDSRTTISPRAWTPIELILPLAPAELNRGLGRIAWPKHNTAHLKQFSDILF